MSRDIIRNCTRPTNDRLEEGRPNRGYCSPDALMHTRFLFSSPQPHPALPRDSWNFPNSFSESTVQESEICVGISGTTNAPGTRRGRDHRLFVRRLVRCRRDETAALRETIVVFVTSPVIRAIYERLPNHRVARTPIYSSSRSRYPRRYESVSWNIVSFRVIRCCSVISELCKRHGGILRRWQKDRVRRVRKDERSMRVRNASPRFCSMLFRT